MSIFLRLTKRNVKLFFKDKGMFFTSIITPGILLVLYATFLANVYRDSFLASLPEGFAIADDIIDGLVGGQLMSSLLAVSCVTVAVCSNFLMVQDRSGGAFKDFSISAIKPSILSMSYYVSTLISTLAVSFTAAVLSFIYLAVIGWYLSFADVIFLLIDIILLVLFGTAISSVICHFLSTQGQISAVGTIISAGYGFICGAYMPISSFGDGLQKAVACLPSTYGTVLLRNHSVRGVLAEMSESGVPDGVIDGIRDSIDCNIYFFDNSVSFPVMYFILGGATLLLVGVYVLLNILKNKKAR